MSGHAHIVSSTASLRAAREGGDALSLVRLLRSMMTRNHLHVDEAELHCECRVGTKRVVSEFVAEQVRLQATSGRPRMAAAHGGHAWRRYVTCIQTAKPR